MEVVFDASAMIAYLRHETGAEYIDKLLTDDNQLCLAHAVNVCEVYYEFLRATDEATASATIIALVKTGLVIREDMDTEFWMIVGRLKAKHRVSIADACGLALAHRLQTEFISTDHHELDPLVGKGICTIRFIR